MEKPTHEFLLEIAYKSGYSFQMWFITFSIADGEWEWQTSDAVIRPMLLGVDDIVSVIQIETRKIKDIV